METTEASQQSPDSPERGLARKLRLRSPNGIKCAHRFERILPLASRSSGVLYGARPPVAGQFEGYRSGLLTLNGRLRGYPDVKTQVLWAPATSGADPFARDFVSRIPSRQGQLSNQPAFGGASAEGLAMGKFGRI
jgi:hypothetical protein